jgi:hypothetical protein
MSDVTWRAARASDAAGLVELFRAIARAAPIGLETDSVGVASRLSRAGVDLDRDILVGLDNPFPTSRPCPASGS